MSICSNETKLTERFVTQITTLSFVSNKINFIKNLGVTKNPSKLLSLSDYLAKILSISIAIRDLSENIKAILYELLYLFFISSFANLFFN